MGKIKQIIIMHQDVHPGEPLDDLESMRREFDRYIARTGGRIGLTDEQMREVDRDE